MGAMIWQPEWLPEIRNQEPYEREKTTTATRLVRMLAVE